MLKFSFIQTPFAILALASGAFASAPTPGSLLIYPEFDNRNGELTLITLTNVASDPLSTVDVHVNYIDATTCQSSDRLKHLTARDTVTSVTAGQAPGIARGYMWCYAQSPTTHAAIDFDNLIGMTLRVDGVLGISYEIAPCSFQGRTAPGTPTDLNFNGRPDLDGNEYDHAPNRIWIPRFFGQANDPLPRGTEASDLILFQPLGASNTTTNVGLLIWNDNEEGFSSALTFQCWTRARLLTITGVFAQSFLVGTNQSPTEIEGLPTVEAGWFEVKGNTSTSSAGVTTYDPPILGALIDIRPWSGAVLPFMENL